MAPKSKLSPAKIAEARARKAADPTITNQALAEELGVSRTTLQKALGAELLPTTGSHIAELDLALLLPSPLNPRRTFTEESIAALAETIAARGLLQNLMVRKPSESGHFAIVNGISGHHAGFYEIVFGERRFRALQLLAKQGRWDKTVSCIIADIDDATHLSLALLENVQREDVPPLEEADGIARLHNMDPETYSTQAIADRIGRSQRYVQQRISISSNLVAPAKALLRGRILNVECSRLLAAESEAVQLEVLSDWELDEITDDTDLAGLEEELMEPITPSGVHQAVHYIHERQDREKAGAARAAAPPPQAEMRLDSTSAAEPRQRQEKPDTSSPVKVTKPEPDSGPSVTKGHIFHAHRRKTFALRNALAADHITALRVACMALLGPQTGILIHGVSPASDDDPGHHGMPGKAIDATIKRVLGKTEVPKYATDGKALKLWKHLLTVKGQDLKSLFSALIARQVHTPAGYSGLLGDDPLPEAVAVALDLSGNEEKHGLALQDEDLAGLRKPTLLAIADETGVPGVNDSTKLGELQDAIAKKRKRHDYVIPTLRFGSTKQLEKALVEMGK